MILTPNRKTKEALKTVFAAPPPLHKKEFLQKTAPIPAKLSLFSFLLILYLCICSCVCACSYVCACSCVCVKCFRDESSRAPYSLHFDQL